MIPDGRIDGSIWEDLPEKTENSSDDSSVAGFRRLPNTMINHVAGVINQINAWMLASDALQCVFECLPGLITLSKRALKLASYNEKESGFYKRTL